MRSEWILGPSRGMQTVQRHADPYIPPWTASWSKQLRLGFGFLAFLPGFLLTVFFASLAGRMLGIEFASNVLPLLFYTHVGAQFIVLLLFGHLMISNALLSDRARLIWAALFLFAAPFAIPLYWGLHLWHPESRMPDEQTPHTSLDRHVHVYDYDYTHGRHHEDELRDDGAMIHHVDATA